MSPIELVTDRRATPGSTFRDHTACTVAAASRRASAAAPRRSILRVSADAAPTTVFSAHLKSVYNSRYRTLKSVILDCTCTAPPTKRVRGRRSLSFWKSAARCRRRFVLYSTRRRRRAETEHTASICRRCSDHCVFSSSQIRLQLEISHSKVSDTGLHCSAAEETECRAAPLLCSTTTKAFCTCRSSVPVEMPRSARNTHLAKLAKTRHANAAKAQKAQKDGNGSSSNHADSAVSSSQASPAQTTNSNTPPDDWTCTNGKYYPPEAFMRQIGHLSKSKRALYNRLFDFYGGSFNSLLSAQKAARWAQSWTPTADVFTNTPLENSTDSHGAAIPKNGVAEVVQQHFARDNKPTDFYLKGPVDTTPLPGGGQAKKTPKPRKPPSGRAGALTKKKRHDCWRLTIQHRRPHHL